MQTYDPGQPSTAGSLEELAEQLEAPRVFWMMVPAGEITESTFQQLLGIADPDDVIVDGGNSNFRDSQRRHAEAQEKGIHFVDVRRLGRDLGPARGVLPDGGRRRGAGVAARRRSSRRWRRRTAGRVVGGRGAGHFTKMVHNGIEYGMMQAYAEGFEIMKASEFDLDLAEVAGIWRYGSVVRSWLLELLYNAFSTEGGDLPHIKGYVEDSGEGRWTIFEAINENVPAPVITASLYARFASRQPESFAAKVNAALRNQFGGHAVKTE